MREIALIAAGLILASCDGVSLKSLFSSGIEGYWKGYCQFESSTVGGERREQGYSKKPWSIYLKLEQTDLTVIGVYSTEFDALSFKATIPKDARQVWGTVHKTSVKLTFQNGDLLPPIIFEGSLHNGTLRGTFSQTYQQGTTRETVYFGYLSIQKY